MIKLSLGKVLQLHQLMAAATGGSTGVRDDALLDSALKSAFASYDGHDLYPGKEEKGARLGFSLISNHAFVDGNKRIGIYLTLPMDKSGGFSVRPPQPALARSYTVSPSV